MCANASAFAGDLNKDCESAVDAADRVGSEIDKECDYSNVGLNGVLHRALSKKEEVSGADKPSNTKPSNAKPSNTKPSNEKPVIEKNVIHTAPRVASAEFGSALQLAESRYELIQKAAQECTAGFVITEERYTFLRAPVMKLEFHYVCF